MARKKNLTADELRATMDLVDDATQAAIDLADALGASRIDRVHEPLQVAMSLNALAKASSDAAMRMINRHKLQEQQRELDALRENAAKVT
jgi:hypothetical protein